MKKSKIFKNFYRDSVTLMQLSAKVSGLEGVTMASALMGTPANIKMMMEAGLLEQAPEGVAPNDMIFVVNGGDAIVETALAEFEKLLNPVEKQSTGQQEEKVYTSQVAALKDHPEATLALISVPGEYAGAEAMKALRRGLNVMLFSDNVSVEDEIALKQYATDHGLLVMGPDCGTAIISGVPLAFANVVTQGRIGLVGASGTGTQEVTSLIDQLGEGISQAIGTGGHDLSEAVGGLSMKAGLKMLMEDPATEVIVLVSKPPAQSVSQALLALTAQTKKPVVVCFLGAPSGSLKGANLTQANTLEEAAHKAVALARGLPPDWTSQGSQDAALQKEAAPLKAMLKPGQKYLRGLYSGGTFCYEALLSFQNKLDPLYGNTPTGKVKELADRYTSVANTIIDLGDDEFTHGKPHPMIDPSQRNTRIIQEAHDPETAVMLLDVVIGYGANPDPAGELARTVLEAQAIAKRDGREIVFIAFVCGTAKDPQGLDGQRQQLAKAGLHLCQSNAQAVALAAAVMGV